MFMNDSPRAYRLLNLGMVDYVEAMDIQRRLVQDVRDGRAPHTLIICQHPSVITYTRRSGQKNIMISEDLLAKKGIARVQADRGGDVTYHGPGQAVFYPIFDLRDYRKDLHLYMRLLEEAVIQPLRERFGLNAYRRQGLTGVWVGPYKIAFIGIAVRDWVTYHGMSLNVSVDKEPFSLIKPCGLDVQVGSIGDFFQDEVSFDAICDMIVENMEKLFNLKSREVAGNGKGLLAGIG